ncbi:MAG: hydantoinase/oxoprolinase family protein [Rhodospirillales bacterium]|jgi:N-methylhydantoinase A|nr:hydantoinase/oxoprolinase family protein [Rhodospirillales bacterium]MDP6884142.1 hydantoinase/oxoprolinase family protein [Rhodospirillales bacterium]
MAHRYRLGIDVGGTFTDGILINEETGETRIAKVPSTPKDPSIGFLEAVERILREAGIETRDVGYLVHGTTVATNAIIEGNLSPTGFITTEGFRDMLEIQRQIRPALYDLLFEKPQPLAPRYLCFGIPERLDATGEVLTALDEKAVAAAAEQLKKEGVEALAVCYLHSYLNPAHEMRTREIVQEVFPDAVVSLSSEVAPEFREYFRASTTVINAGVRPIVERYLSNIEDRLRDAGLKGELLIMQSSGGVLTFEAARTKPVFMVESGPAAGVIVSAHLGQVLGFDNIMSFDMGGTTAKTGLIEHGTPRITKEYEVGTAARAERGAKGAGYPIRTPVIDLVEIGAGGGSIAWVDPGGMLRVGPQSAGADPAPVAYGQGGTEPTITDANLVLHRLDADHFLGGEMRLDEEAAYQAIKEKCADPLGLDVVEVALGIVEIANTVMSNALRRISVQRGYDPRDFVLVAFGGAGPVHANRLAVELEIPTILVPMSPGTTSAMGLLVTDLKHDYSTTLIQRTDQLDAETVNRLYGEMEERGKKALVGEGMEHASIGFERQVEMRYVGQSYELPIPLGDGKVEDALEGMLRHFHEEHERAYGFAAPDEPVEFVTLRHTAVGSIAKPKLRELPEREGDVKAACRAVRQVFFAEAGGFVDCPSYDRYQLAAGGVIEGPAIIEEMDSTTVIHPEFLAEVDRYGNLLIKPRK